MGTLTIGNVRETGLTASYEAATAAGDVADNREGKTILHYKNGSGSPITVTVTPQVTDLSNPGQGEVTKGPATHIVPAGGESFMGPFAPGVFNNTSRQIVITATDDTTLTVAALNVQ